MFLFLVALVMSFLLFQFGPARVPRTVFGPLEVSVPSWFDPGYWFDAAIESGSTSTLTSFGLSAVGVTSTTVLAANYIRNTMLSAASHHCGGCTRSGVVKSSIMILAFLWAVMCITGADAQPTARIRPEVFLSSDHKGKFQSGYEWFRHGY